MSTLDSAAVGELLGSPGADRYRAEVEQRLDALDAAGLGDRAVARIVGTVGATIDADPVWGPRLAAVYLRQAVRDTRPAARLAVCWCTEGWMFEVQRIDGRDYEIVRPCRRCRPADAGASV